MPLKKFLSRYHGRKLWVEEKEAHNWQIWVEDTYGLVVRLEIEGKDLSFPLEIEGTPGRYSGYRTEESAKEDVTAWARNTMPAGEPIPTDNPTWIDVNSF